MNWERYEKQREVFAIKFSEANEELEAIKRIYNLEEGAKDLNRHKGIAQDMREKTESTFHHVDDANNILAKLMGPTKKEELAKEASLKANKLPFNI